uniref:Uncharacterized protein PHLOEM PROTEIN 2-LIKE A4 n=1 Tax=Anthurium amnicola TaxID=1678845 RepID=A0A1D1Y1H4_9ARAE
MGSWTTSISWEARVVYDVDKLIDMGAEYNPVVKMRLVGESNVGWQNPVYLDIHLPEQEDVLSNQFNVPQIPLNRLSDFSFPSFAAPSSDKKMKMTFLASTKQNSNLRSALIVSDWVNIDEGKRTDRLSINWNMEFMAEFGAQSLTTGATYKFSIPMVLKGTTHGGWNEPVIIQVLLPDGTKMAKTVNPNKIPLNTQNVEFASREFPAPGVDKKITLLVSTTQRTNLYSVLNVGEAKIKLV